jgi:SAM-dependent methyltransferase
VRTVSGGPNLQETSYGAKPQSYYTKPRADYVDLLPQDPNASILELGCGDGATGALALRNGKCGSYVGIEMFVPMAERAREVLTSVHVGNVENMELPYAAASFDALILSEVLEHLVDPQAVLNRLAVLLRPGALVFASSPNIAHWSNILGLCLGRFEYTESGMMDRTHLRWFTPASFAAMFEAAGVKVDRVAPLNRLGRRAKLLRFLLGRRFDAVWFYQINLHGHRI